MDKDTLIFGTIITLLATILSFLLNSAYNWISRERERNWIIADRNYQRRVDVLSRRLGEAEINTNQFLDIAEKVIEYEHMLLASRAILAEPPDPEDLASYRLAVAKHREERIYNSSIEITRILAEANRQRASIFNLNDPELIKLTGELGDCIVLEMDVADLLKEKIKKDEAINSEVEQKRIFDFSMKTLNMRKLAISRIDHLAGFNI